MKRVVMAFFVLTVLSTLVTAQEAPWQDPGYDTNYVKSFKDYMVVTLVSATTNNALSVTDAASNQITFQTNQPYAFGLALDYKWFTAEYTSTFGRTGVPEKGFTKMNSMGFGLTGRKFWFRNFYQRTAGYYLANPTYFNPDFNPATDIYPQRADVQSSVYFANLNYGFNHRRFSNMAALWQLERQKKSAGSFTTGLCFSHANYRADSALVPRNGQPQFTGTDFITDFTFTMFGINAGYLHTFAFTKSRKFFISLALIPGISYQTGSGMGEGAQGQLYKSNWGAHAEGRLVFGYNGDTWYTSVSSVAYAVSSHFENVNPFTQGYSFFRFVAGYKLFVPKHDIKILKKIGL